MNFCIHAVEPPQPVIILDPVIVKCHNDSYDIFVTWESQGNADDSQVSYEYQLVGSTESESEILQEMNTTATVANITVILSHNYTNITFYIIAHNCAGSSNEKIHIIQIKGEIII